MKKAFYILLLIFLIPEESLADFSTNALIGYLTGIPALSELPYGNKSGYEYPAELAQDITQYIKFTGSRQEVFRNFLGEHKNIDHGLFSIGLNYPLIENTAGTYISFTDNRSSISWPFSKNRIRTVDSYKAGTICVSGYTFARENVRVGATIGKQIKSDRNRLLHIVEFSGAVSQRLNGSMRYFSLPYEWGVDINYKNITKTLPSHFQYTGFEGNITYSLTEHMHITFSGEKGDIDTPKKFQVIPDNHTQMWNGSRDRWKIRILNSPVADIVLDASYGEDTLSGELNLCYDGDQYMQGTLDGDTRRFGFGVQLEDVKRYIPVIHYDRVSTELALSRGIADSWPFTPKQIEIIGDKTWTFSGTGSIVSDSGTFSWKLSSLSRMVFSYVRAHFDYRLRITTRDHLSTNPLDMIYGKSRIETDRTRYYDFAHVYYGRNYIFGRLSLEFGISQFIPVHHSRKKIPGKAPAPPSFPELKIKKPENFGGFSFEVNGKWLF
ncbi:MAG TPA: hypothetical protein VMZ04_08630 [Anaerolineae bacterium]|nr:hypothetical protein [Anaerolineae bacterium]